MPSDSIFPFAFKDKIRIGGEGGGRPRFYLYSKDDISRFLKDPCRFEKELRQALRYIYGASSHFHRLIDYFAGLSDFSYIIAPAEELSRVSKRIIKKEYLNVSRTLASMDIRSQFPNILTVCLREDVFYGTFRSARDSITVQQLPSDYCAVSSIEGNVLNCSFDFSYFDRFPQRLSYYPGFFREKYSAYKKDTARLRWQELESPLTFAIKCSGDSPEYPMPPFAGVLRDVYDLEDYKQLKMSKTELDNYAMLVMTIGLNEDGEWSIDLNKAREFWQNLSAVIPQEVGSVLTPLPIEKISFEKTNTQDTDTIAQAEQNLFSSAGVSSLLFNNEKASANALTLSIKADQALTFGIVKSIECAVNRYLKTVGKHFRLIFLDCSTYNRKELGDMYLKACQYGLPFISMYSASQGMLPDMASSLSYLENDILGLTERFTPLQSSATLSADSQPGRPEKEISELTEEGEETRERK